MSLWVIGTGTILGLLWGRRSNAVRLRKELVFEDRQGFPGKRREKLRFVYICGDKKRSVLRNLTFVLITTVAVCGFVICFAGTMGVHLQLIPAITSGYFAWLLVRSLHGPALGLKPYMVLTDSGMWVASQKGGEGLRHVDWNVVRQLSILETDARSGSGAYCNPIVFFRKKIEIRLSDGKCITADRVPGTRGTLADKFEEWLPVRLVRFRQNRAVTSTKSEQ